MPPTLSGTWVTLTCVCVLSPHLFWTPVYTSLYVWAHQQGSHRRKVNTGVFVFSPPSFAVLALIFILRRVRPSLFLVDFLVNIFILTK